MRCWRRPRRRTGVCRARASPRHCTAAPNTASAARAPGRPRWPLTSNRYTSETWRWPAPAATATNRPGTTSSATTASSSTPRRARSSAAAGRREARRRRGSWPIRSTPSSTAWDPARRSAGRCLTIFTAGASSPPGCAPCWRSATSTRCAPPSARNRWRRRTRRTSRRSGSPVPQDPERARYLTLLQATLLEALAALDARDRLRLAYYYVQELTLAEIGRLLGEHEATASRHLERTRRVLRRQVERALAGEKRLSEAQIRLCFEYALEEWPFDLTGALGAAKAQPGRGPTPVRKLQSPAPKPGED